jgi:hypothetical protein
MANTIRFRTSISEGMTTMWDNVMYSMAPTQASNPRLYALPKMSKLLKDFTGGNGIALPFLNVMGFGAELNTSVAELMMVAAMAGSALGAIGPLVMGISDIVNPLAGSRMMALAEIDRAGSALKTLARGSAPALQNTKGASLSESGSLVGQSDGESIKKQTMQDAEDDKKKQMVEAKDEESADDVVLKSQLAVVSIYNLLEEMAHGSESLRVRVINGNVCTCGGASSSTLNNNQNGLGGNNTNDGQGATATYGPNGVDNGNWIMSF